MRRALAVLLLAACEIERTPAMDSAAGDVAANDVAARDTTIAAADDTLAGLAADTAADTAPAPVVAPTRPGARDDTTAIVATPAELAELRATLVIPVAHVPASALRDAYDEARGTRVHQAIDIPAPRGTPVLAATDGRVLKLHRSVAGGLMVYAADASDRFVLMYGHLDAWAPGLAEGQTLRRGQAIGTVGTTGNAPPGTPHLHFVVARGRPGASWWRGTPVNPYPLLAR